MIDTHTHLYLPEFQDDIDEVMARAEGAGLRRCWLPAIDASSLPLMQDLDRRFPGYFSLFAGLHPTEITDDYQAQLSLIYKALQSGGYKGIGEIGMDLYWDTSRKKEQEEVLRTQLDWAVEMDLPVLLHVRNAFDETLAIVREYYNKGLRGIFHCFSGNYDQAKEIVEHGFL
ncbi:MAG: TatD family hydrolase, partial [Bacteroidales bacterium]|nr:TatD family hydrolase [Bacteroidales bacterium]